MAKKFGDSFVTDDHDALLEVVAHGVVGLSVRGILGILVAQKKLSIDVAHAIQQTAIIPF